MDQVKDKTGGLVGQVTSKTADLTVILGDKVGVYYEQAMEATGETKLKINFLIKKISRTPCRCKRKTGPNRFRNFDKGKPSLYSRSRKSGRI